MDRKLEERYVRAESEMSSRTLIVSILLATSVFAALISILVVGWHRSAAVYPSVFTLLAVFFFFVVPDDKILVGDTRHATIARKTSVVPEGYEAESDASSIDD
ncbi:hypothetical protein BKA64DRAFT_711745 [Cadophora sp. MPI-SDFR-AT-0126]|nr:hypothetical protein BKA64DRAFT_711745 [Leotiomycetes sp. MPI-SDFR-AT-0126]